MTRRTYLMLAQIAGPTFIKEKTDRGLLKSYLVSEKLDGVRVFWDGGVSRGMLASDVPYANIAKDFRRLAQVRATGLWTRYGKSIQAPGDWLNKLPLGLPLDGELFIGRGMFQRTVSVTKAFNSALSDWEDVKFMAFDTPSYESFSRVGKINEVHHQAEFDAGVRAWLKDKGAVSALGPMADFAQSNRYLRSIFEERDSFDLSDSDQGVFCVRQMPAEGVWEDYYSKIIDVGGEGVMFRAGWSSWVALRSWDLLKMKPSTKAVGEVIGWKSGRETDKGSKLLGLMGALKILWDGKEFLLSGFTDGERSVIGDAEEWAVANPDCEHPTGDGLLYFHLGDKVDFRFSELSVEGVPLKASYLREGRKL